MIYTNFTRHDGSPVSLRWGGWHRNCFISAYYAETGKYRFPEDGRYTYTREHLFIDPADGEVLIIATGDTYSER